MGRTTRTCSLVAALISATPAAADVPQSVAAYVKARAADGDGAGDVAVAGYARALQGAPTDPVVAIRAYRRAIEAGDIKLARTALSVLERAGVAPIDGMVLRLTDAVRARDWAAADAALAAATSGPLDFIGPIARAWIATERGRAAAALDAPVASGLSARLNAEHRALLLLASGDINGGLTLLRAALGADAGSRELRVDAATLLNRAGRGDAARSLLVGDDPVLARLREDLTALHVTPGAAFGIGRLFTRVAAGLVDGEARPLAIVLARGALELDTRDDRARLLLAQALAASGGNARALAVLDGVGERSIYAGAALDAHIDLLTRSGQPARALLAAERAADAEAARSTDVRRRADLLVELGRFDEAATGYAAVLAQAGADAEWLLHVQHGSALEQAGRWPEGRAALRRAVTLAPDEPLALNQLGYGLVERGEDLRAATAMLEKALRIEPNDAAITDSLGWAYVRSGALAKGLPLIERAARAEPANETIHEHLGDAYWRLGRRYEARYAWQAAALVAGGANIERLTAKLATGLP